MGNLAKKVQEAGLIITVLGILGFTGLIWLMIYGNLSGNLGFAANTQGANDTQSVINNLTGGYKAFFGFAPLFFQISAIVLLITIMFGLVLLAIDMYKKLNQSFKGGGGYSGGYD